MLVQGLDETSTWSRMLAGRRRLANRVAVQVQRLAGAGHAHLAVAAQRFQGAVDGGQPVLRGGDAQLALVDLFAQMVGVVLQGGAVDQARVIDAGSGW